VGPSFRPLFKIISSELVVLWPIKIESEADKNYWLINLLRTSGLRIKNPYS
jgi:hypothetical protein